MNKKLSAQIRNKLQAPKTALELLSQGKDVPKEFIERANAVNGAMHLGVSSEDKI